MKKVIYFLFFCLETTSFSQENWKTIDEGLFLGTFSSPVISKYSDSKITVLKINPKNYQLNLVCATENERIKKTVEEWCVSKKFLAAVNAGMFHGYDETQSDNFGLTNTGFTKNFKHYNNSKMSASDNSVIAFNRIDTTLPAVQIIDLKCQNWLVLKNKYNTFIQGLRMIDCNQVVKWQKDSKMWSACVMAIDKQGNVLWIFCRSPYTMYNFSSILLKLPLNIYNMIYLEGGPEASFYLSAKGTTLKKFGSFETGFNENDTNNHYWNLPNIIGITKKK